MNDNNNNNNNNKVNEKQVSLQATPTFGSLFQEGPQESYALKSLAKTLKQVK